MGGTVFTANKVECPKCHSVFEHNMVNGIALVDTVSRIEARKRMYCRLTLDGIERLDGANFAVAKKIILDNFNDYNRDIQTILGFGLEAE